MRHLIAILFIVCFTLAGQAFFGGGFGQQRPEEEPGGLVLNAPGTPGPQVGERLHDTAAQPFGWGADLGALSALRATGPRQGVEQAYRAAAVWLTQLSGGRGWVRGDTAALQPRAVPQMAPAGWVVSAPAAAAATGPTAADAAWSGLQASRDIVDITVPETLPAVRGNSGRVVTLGAAAEAGCPPAGRWLVDLLARPPLGPKASRLCAAGWHGIAEAIATLRHPVPAALALAVRPVARRTL